MLTDIENAFIVIYFSVTLCSILTVKNKMQADHNHPCSLYYNRSCNDLIETDVIFLP